MEAKIRLVIILIIVISHCSCNNLMNSDSSLIDEGITYDLGIATETFIDSILNEDKMHVNYVQLSSNVKEDKYSFVFFPFGSDSCGLNTVNSISKEKGRFLKIKKNRFKILLTEDIIFWNDIFKCSHTQLYMSEFKGFEIQINSEKEIISCHR